MSVKVKANYIEVKTNQHLALVLYRTSHLLKYDLSDLAL